MIQFLDLPYEIRSLIYQCTVEPRDINLRWSLANPADTKGHHTEGHLKHVTSSAPVPVALHLCQESRRLLTKRHCKSSAPIFHKAFRIGAVPRYIWVNFDMDVISLGRSQLHELEEERRRVRRLKIERECDMLWYEECYDLQMFSRLEELYVICGDGRLVWADGLYGEPLCWPLPREKVWVCNQGDREMVTLLENDYEAREVFQFLQTTTAEDDSLEGFLEDDHVDDSMQEFYHDELHQNDL